MMTDWLAMALKMGSAFHMCKRQRQSLVPAGIWQLGSAVLGTGVP
jgi:hypothetical protein